MTDRALLILFLGVSMASAAEETVLFMFAKHPNTTESKVRLQCAVQGEAASSEISWSHHDYNTSKPITGFLFKPGKMISWEDDVGDWQEMEALQWSLPPLLNHYRWEKLTNWTTWGTDTFEAITKLPNTTFWSIGISVLVEDNAHMYFCAGGDKSGLQNCYWIIINGWREEGIRSEIRRCSQILSDKNKNDCEDITETQEDSRIGQLGDWLHLKIDWNTRPGNLKISYRNVDNQFKKILIWTDPKPFAPSIFASQSSKEGTWLIHDYKAMGLLSTATRTTLRSKPLPNNLGSICVSFFYIVYTDQSLHIYLDYSDGSKILDEINGHDTQGGIRWRGKQYKIEEDIRRDTETRLVINATVKTYSSVVAVIDSFSISECNTQGNVRVSALEVPITSLQENLDIECYLESNPSIRVKWQSGRQEKATARDIQTAGRLCSKANGGQRCEATILCGASYCACSPGYYTPLCRPECGRWQDSSNKYGPGCGQDCGQCAYAWSRKTRCHHVTGKCRGSACHGDFRPPNCLARFLSLRQRPTLFKAEPTILQLTFNVGDTDGSGILASLEVHYKKKGDTINGETWRTQIFALTSSERLMSYFPVNLTNLTKSTSYEVRGILVDTKGGRYINDTYPPVYTFNTNCEADLKLKEKLDQNYPRKVKLYKQSFESENSCGFNAYTLWQLYPQMEAGVTVRSSEVDLPPLQPYTNYTFQLVGNGNIVVQTIVFKTLEDAPSKPVELTLDVRADGVALTWQQPDKPNGIIRSFALSFTPTRSWLKDWTVFSIINITLPVNEYHATYSHTVRKLLPSTTYTVKVSGVTVKVGPGISQQFVTPLAVANFPNDALAVESASRTDTSATIIIPAAPRGLTSQSLYILVVVPDKYTEERSTVSDKLTRSLLLRREILANISDDEDVRARAWIVAELVPQKESFRFVIGQNKSCCNYYLDPDANYQVYVVVLNQQGKEKKYSIVKTDISSISRSTEPIPQLQNDGLYALLLLLVFPAVGIYLLYKKYKLKKQNGRGEQLMHFSSIKNAGLRKPPTWVAKRRVIVALHQHDEATQEYVSSYLRVAKVSSYLIAIDMTTMTKPACSDPSVSTIVGSRPRSTTQSLSVPVPKSTSTTYVKICDLSNYVSRSLLAGDLKKQHEMFPRGQTKPWDYGRQPENRKKNRYGNLIAYDDTRVVLDKLPDDQFSDYINANYIDGYKKPRMYIATQGPRLETIVDFWRMVWQEQVQVIAMLTNIVENGKAKCEQYWPDGGKELTCGQITILTGKIQVFADYTFRQFHLSSTTNNETRKVLQLHFTSWPDHGVPLYPQSVAAYLKKLLATPLGEGPLLVHCSAGVGRTGTIIVADACLRMAASEGAVDVLSFLKRARKCRANMVDNYEQYKLIHLALIECLVTESTALQCDGSFVSNLKRLKESGAISKVYQRLGEDAPIADREPDEDTEQTELVRRQEWESHRHKNRVQDIVPGSTGRVFLSRFDVNDPVSDYINAVSVDGFRIKNQFIATQFPLETTTADFWRMIAEKQVSVMVALNEFNLADKASCLFWPTQGVVMTLTSDITVILKEESARQHCITRQFLLLIKSDTEPGISEWQVTMLHLIGWVADDALPSTTGLLELWQETERVYSGGHPIVVCCYDGASACGLFLALSFMIEKMKLEQECDVAHAVRTIRHNRRQFLPTQMQFEWLYDAARSYLEAFETYANFQ